MNSFQDYSIFNAANPSALEPNRPKTLPFPLENVDTEISEVYVQIDRLLARIVASKISPVNQTPAKKKRLKSLEYKVKTCMHLMKEVSTQIQWLAI